MSTSQFPTPILFLIFNRPDTTKTVFEKIKQVKPKYLFISADGPRINKEGERELCNKTRDIVKKIDWDCELKTNFRENNLGCKIAVSSGIDWFFESVEEGIILEDDCLPDISFFHFCKTLLEKYRDDVRVMHIGGSNFQDGIIRGDGSYYFSKYAHIWGWATWRRAWRNYDVFISSFKNFLETNSAKNIFTDENEEEFWLKLFNLVYSNNKDTWDYQWEYACLINNGLSIIPNKNLVSNIGFGIESTHTASKSHPLADKPIEKIDDFIHPAFVVPDQSADRYALTKYFNPHKLAKLKLWLYQFLKK